jgi:DNA-binding LacI/PurR family transcriptional regulator
VKRVKPTMRDVAQAANISASAVWMVIHNKPGIPETTSKRVWEVISQLGYVVKPNDQDVVNQSQSVGVLIEKSSIPAIMDSFYGDIMRGFQTEAQRLGYQITLVMFDRTTDNVDVLTKGFAGKVSGLIVANDGDITPEMVIPLKALDVPVVLIENHIDAHRFPCVLGDNFTAGYVVTQHILSLGHRSIAVLPGPKKYSSLVDRLRGCMAALAEADLLVPLEWMPQPVSKHPLKGYLQMKEILVLVEHPTAVIAISDKTALGAIEAIKEVGLRIPDDIAIASIDNIAESAYARPPLTTVHIPKYEMGVLALQKLDNLINSKESVPVKTIVYSELIVRESCGSGQPRLIES